MQGKCVSEAQVRTICLELGLALSHEQKRRVARGYALFMADHAKLAYQCPQYEFWLCASQSCRAVYFIWITPRGARCNCPDYRNGNACKHTTAVLLARKEGLH